MDSPLVGLGEGCIRHIGEFLTTLDAYRMYCALLPHQADHQDLITNFSTLSSIMVTPGETAGVLGSGSGWSDEDLQRDLREALKWAVLSVSKNKRDIRKIRLYGMLDGVDFWEIVHSSDQGPIRHVKGPIFRNLEVLHCDIMTRADLEALRDIMEGDGEGLRNLKSLNFTMDNGALLDASMGITSRWVPSLHRGEMFGLGCNTMERTNSRFHRWTEEEKSMNLDEMKYMLATLMDKFRSCPLIEDLGDMNGWSVEMVEAFHRSTYGDADESLPWASLKSLDLGVLRQEAVTWANYNTWEEAQMLFDDQGLGPFLVDRGADEHTEAVYFSLISFLRADAFPSLEKLIVVSNDDTEDLSQFFFAWIAYDFHVKLAALYERSSPSEKEEIAHKTPRVRLYVEFFKRRGYRHREAPVAASVRKLQLVCSQLSVDDLSFNEDYLEGNRGTDSFVYIERWRELMAWLRVKERHHPKLFPLALFPNLEEIESNCGLPYKEFASFLKGELHAPLPSLRLYTGSLAHSTAGALLSQSSLINVGHFEVLPDMGTPIGMVAHALQWLDWADPTKRALYRLLRAYLQSGPRELHGGVQNPPVALLSGPLMELYSSTNPVGEVLPWRWDAPGARGAFKALQPLLLSECIARDSAIADETGSSDVGGPSTIKLVLPETLDGLLGIHKGAASPKGFDTAWMTAVKNGAFASGTHSFTVPDWLLGNLCCSLGRDKSPQQRSGFSAMAFFPFDRRVHRPRSQLSMNGEGNEVRDVVVEVWDTGKPLHVRGAGSVEAVRASVLRRVAQLFCHTPALRHLTISTGPWSMGVNDTGEESVSDEVQEEAHEGDGESEDSGADFSKPVFAPLRHLTLRDAHWSPDKRAYVLLSFQTLVEAMCELRFRATQDADYLARDPDVPFLPDRVRYGEVNSELSLSALPVALGELECLELRVQAGHTTIYQDLREQVLQMSFEGVSGTTLLHKACPALETSAGNRAAVFGVADAFIGGYTVPKSGDDVHRRMLRVVLSHGDRERTPLYLWRDGDA